MGWPFSAPDCAFGMVAVVVVVVVVVHVGLQ
jgi:hypothetical protein